MKVTLNKFKKINLACAITAALSVLISSTAYSAERVKHVIDIPADVKTASGKTAPQPYRPVADVTPEQAQIVVYYPEGSVPATIYVDRELQSVLLPGQFTVLCAAPGAHAVESWFNDHPTYQGKQNPLQQLSTESAQTYFIQVNPGTTGNTAALEERSRAESLLSNMYKQTKIINRASQVKPCDYVNNTGVVLIQEQVLFRFAASNAAGIFAESRNKLDEVVKFTKKANNVSEIQIVGYTDAIGSREANQRLSEARADTVRSLLIEKGIKPELINNTTGKGIAQSAEGCGTSASQQAAGCNVNSRRVEILVKSH
ncbi:TPA: OmpA family protein [Enterobacter cloacae]|uniref:OmpA family protein n=1 Tax=Enterobacter cloacae TaxID=550 RepID=UPI001257DD3D|nr:OmpA family protein [Enterobacter cloacae]VAM43859.1 putative outer membrane lipoprotein [Enterobacter cloacae]HBH7064052.1 OmpA family protein [Enterobacter cloacae]HBH7064479.1 OmpA family protein [Enterobacter cloacae]HCR2031578.1 OmpA family protein [Enterobacter cloacae]